jgi:Alpha/beta hydrolase family
MRGGGALRTLAGAGGLLSAGRAMPDVSRLGIPTGPPPGLTRLGEATAAVQFSRLLAAAPRLARVPRGDGSIVIDLPGWRAPEESGAPIRAFLRRIGWRTYGWGLHANNRDVRSSIGSMERRVSELCESSGRPVALVGWSLGGVIAREVARRRPEQVRHVVTFGSPIVAGPAFTVFSGLYNPADSNRIRSLSESLDRRTPIKVPLTVIYSRRDGVVAWQACIDRVSPHAEHFEVTSPHLGLGIDPDVWEIVARRLAGD